MPGINTSVQVTDRLSPAFRTMTQSINICLSTFAQMQQATGQAVNTDAIRAAQAAMNDLNMEAARIDEELREAATAQYQFNDSVRTGHTAAEGLLGKVKAMVGAYAGMRAVNGVLGLSDEMAQTAARLNLMNDGLQTTAELQEKIYRSAQNSRAAYMDTAGAVSRMGMLAREAFSSNNELIQFTELMNKNFKVGGASAQEQASAMYQLTQAMASGRLQGDEYRSIIENAPLLASAIEDYMVNVQHAEGSMKEWASEGLLTASVIKAAMFNAADEVNAKFAEIPMTWSDVGTSMKNTALMTFQPVLEQINAIASNDNTQIAIQGITNGISTLAEIAGPAVNLLVDGSGWIVNNWSAIEPIVLGVTVAFVAYSAGMTAVTVATHLADLASQGFFLTLLTNPMTWIAVGIGGVVAAIHGWVQSVGGIRVAWAIMSNEVKYGVASLQIGFNQAGNFIMNTCGLISLKFQAMGMNVADFVGGMKVAVVGTISSMSNEAIQLINSFIGALNKIPGVAIEPISVTASFAADVLAEETKKKSERAASYAAAEAAYQKDVAIRDKKMEQMKTKANYEYATGKRNIELMKKEKTTNDAAAGNGNYDAIVGNTAATAANTGKIADSVDISGEDLKYLRDIAERDIIDRTVFRDIKVDLGGVTNNVSEMSDLDGIAEYIGESVRREMLISAEGVH